MEYIQLNWKNWHQVCNFVTDIFIVGVYLDNITKTPTPNNTSDTIGLYINLDNQKTLVKQGEYIIKNKNKKIKILSELKFERKRKLQQLNENF